MYNSQKLNDSIHNLDINIFFLLGPETSCPLPYVESGQHCFRVLFPMQNYTDNVAACIAKGGRIVKIDTMEESDALTRYLVGK